MPWESDNIDLDHKPTTLQVTCQHLDTHHVHNSKGNWVAAPMGTETPMGNCNHSSLRNIMCDSTYIDAEHNEENCCLKLDYLPACGFTVLRIHPSQNLSRLEENQQGSWNQPNECKHQKNCLPCKTTSTVACTKPYQPWHNCKTPHDYEKPSHPAWYMLKCTNHHNGCNASNCGQKVQNRKKASWYKRDLPFDCSPCHDSSRLPTS